MTSSTLLDLKFSIGDAVVVSTDDNRFVGLISGSLFDIQPSYILVSSDGVLRNPLDNRYDSNQKQNIEPMLYRIDQDSNIAGSRTMFTNIAMLFIPENIEEKNKNGGTNTVTKAHSSAQEFNELVARHRELIVDLIVPSFSPITSMYIPIECDLQ